MSAPLPISKELALYLSSIDMGQALVTVNFEGGDTRLEILPLNEAFKMRDEIDGMSPVQSVSIFHKLTH